MYLPGPLTSLIALPPLPDFCSLRVYRPTTRHKFITNTAYLGRGIETFVCFELNIFKSTWLSINKTHPAHDGHKKVQTLCYYNIIYAIYITLQCRTCIIGKLFFACSFKYLFYSQIHCTTLSIFDKDFNFFFNSLSLTRCLKSATMPLLWLSTMFKALVSVPRTLKRRYLQKHQVHIKKIK